MMTDKKYFSIDEVAEIIGVRAYKLRYLEKSAPQIRIFRVRGRRYYTKENIDQIKKRLSFDLKVEASRSSNFNQVIINKIDYLIGKFTELIK